MAALVLESCTPCWHGYISTYPAHTNKASYQIVERAMFVPYCLLYPFHTFWALSLISIYIFRDQDSMAYGIFSSGCCGVSSDYLKVCEPFGDREQLVGFLCQPIYELQLKGVTQRDSTYIQERSPYSSFLGCK